MAAASLVLALSYAGGADGLRKIFSGFFMDSGRDGTEIEESVPASGNSVQEILPAAESEISDTPSVTPAVSGDPAADDSSGSSESSGDSTESSSETGEAAGAESSTPETSGASGTGNAGSSVPDVSETAVQGAEYIVRRGDTLSNICEEYYGNLQRIQDICRMNGITANDIIYPGQKIVLPQ